MDIADRAGLGQVSLPAVGWGTEFADFDGDGWLDLVVANGSTLEIPGPFPRRLQPQAPFLFWNRKGKSFHDLAPLIPDLHRPAVGRGLALADYDLDGSMDILIVQLGEGVQLLKNRSQTGNWLKVRLRNRLPRPDRFGFADGSTAIAHVGETALRRSVSSVSYLSQSSRTLHFGLGDATQVDRLEIHWHAGGVQVLEGLEANCFWEIIEGQDQPRLVVSPPAATLTQPSPNAGHRERVMEFWERQREAMAWLKTGPHHVRAVVGFERALQLDPAHDDSRYYLAHCLAALGDVDGALVQLEELISSDSRSHRALKQWGRLRAVHARSQDDYASAEESLLAAQRINPEETGALMLLAEIALLRQNGPVALERLEAVLRSNPRAAGALYLRAYLARRHGETERVQALLAQLLEALGPEWHPKGATSEGDVREQYHQETTPLAPFWETWAGQSSAEQSFAALDQFLWQPPHSR